jgi:hypothetical protein
VSLRDRPVLYVFLETHDLAGQRRFLESDLNLPVLELIGPRDARVPGLRLVARPVPVPPAALAVTAWGEEAPEVRLDLRCPSGRSVAGPGRWPALIRSRAAAPGTDQAGHAVNSDWVRRKLTRAA